MACATPLVATNAGALPEVVGPDGEAVLRGERNQHVAHDARRRNLGVQKGRRMDDEARIGGGAHFLVSDAGDESADGGAAAARSRSAPLATRMSCTIGMPDGQAKLHEPHSTQSVA